MTYYRGEAIDQIQLVKAHLHILTHEMMTMYTLSPLPVVGVDGMTVSPE